MTNTIYNLGTLTVTDSAITGNSGTSINNDTTEEVDHVYTGTSSLHGVVVTDNDEQEGAVNVFTGGNGEHKTVVTLPEGGSVVVGENGTAEVPEGSKATDKDGKEIDLPFGGTIDKDGTVTPNEDPNAGSNTGDNTTGGNTGSNTGSTGSVDAADEGLTTIEAEAVPLAGPVFVEDVLEELYKYEGSPDGEDPEGEYDLAIAWAIANEIIDEDDDVEEVVTVAILRDILTKYLDFAGIEYTLVIDGEDDDIVDNCGEILTELFAADR